MLSVEVENVSGSYRGAASIMIIASVNGTYGQGFLETIERDDGSIQRMGMLKLSARDAMQLQRCLENRQPLIYSGPVLANGRWCADTFPIVATSIVTDPAAPAIVSITLCDRPTEAAA